MSSGDSAQLLLGASTTEIYDAGSAIPLLAFQVCAGLVFGLAVICALARFWVRFATRRPLYWDDFFLGIGLACLVAATGLLFDSMYNYYLMGAVAIHPELLAPGSSTDLDSLLNNSLAMEYAANSLIWTCIFCVKASFLVFTRKLMHSVPWLNTYFWIVTTVTGLSWVFLICSPFIQCPFLGSSSVRCASQSQAGIVLAIDALVAGLDILTDLLVASIPILLLVRSELDLKQKLVVGPFLALLLILAIFAGIRISKSGSSGAVDVVWLVFWQYMEAGVAMIVTSITTMRTVFSVRPARRTHQPISRSYASVTSRSKVTAPGSAGHFTEIDEQIQLVGPHNLQRMPSAAQILVRETWDVSYSKESNSPEDLPSAVRMGMA